MSRRILSHIAVPVLLLLSNSSGNSAPQSPQSPEVFNAGPDIIAGNMADLYVDGVTGTQNGLAIGVTSCNAGNEVVGFFRDARYRPSGHCPESLSNERWIGQRRSLRANWPGVGQAYLRGGTSQQLQLWLPAGRRLQSSWRGML